MLRYNSRWYVLGVYPAGRRIRNGATQNASVEGLDSTRGGSLQLPKAAIAFTLTRDIEAIEVSRTNAGVRLVPVDI